MSNISADKLENRMSDKAQERLTKNKMALAKLLARENLIVEHQNVPTAYTDLKERRLVLPNWLDLDADLYDLLVGHETSHAIDTPMNEWKSGVENISKDMNAPFADKKAQDRSEQSVRGFINIVEDARVDIRQKNRYPGLRKPYANGMKQLHDRDFFNLKKNNKNVNELPFIDRANIYYKGGAFLNIQFSETEKRFLDRMAKTETFDDVLALSREIYSFAKDGGELNQNDINDPLQDMLEQLFSEFGDESEAGEGSGDSGESEDGEGSDSEDGDSEDGDSEEKGDSGKNSKNSEKEGSEKEDKGQETKSSGDKGPEGAKGDKEENKKGNSDSKEGSEKDKDGKENESTRSRLGQKKDYTPTGNKKNKKNTSNEMPFAETEEIFAENMKTLANNKVNLSYVDIPQFNLKNLIVPYKRTLALCDEKFFKKDNHYDRTEDKDIIETYVDKFMTADKPLVSYMAKEFEMKKAASAYARTLSSKTGVINTNRLHSYQISDDIFKRVTVTPNGKNHGFIMLIDWSGSMSGTLHETIKQLITLTTFCSRVNVPFQVFSFVSGAPNEATNIIDGYQYGKNVINKGTNSTLNSQLNQFFLRELLSSKMNRQEYNRAVLYLLCQQASIPGMQYIYNSERLIDGMGGTPLNSALLALPEIVNNFKRDNNVQIMNVIVLTDGDSDPVYTSNRYSVKSKNIFRKKNRSWVESDDSNYNSYSSTKLVLRILKEETDSNLIGINLVQNGSDRIGIHGLRLDGDIMNTQRKKDLWKKEGFTTLNRNLSGYDQEFVLNQKFFLDEGSKSFEYEFKDLGIGSKAKELASKNIGKRFAEYSQTRRKSRLLARMIIDFLAVKNNE